MTEAWELDNLEARINLLDAKVDLIIEALEKQGVEIRLHALEQDGEDV